MHTLWSYVEPEAVGLILRRLASMKGGVIGLIGLQGVGKSNALIAIETALVEERERVKRDTGELPKDTFDYRVLRFKWQRQQQLLASFLNGMHPLSGAFRRKYAEILLAKLKLEDSQYFSFFGPQLSEVEKHPETLNLKFVEKPLGQRTMRSLLQVAWLSLLREQENILIDTPDYSRTDRRSMVKDLDEIHSLWDTLSSISSKSPNFVIAIQKELSKGHFFFGRMEMIELVPLRPMQMRSAYVKQFKTTWPFTRDALLALARMSRGVFRRYLRYITLTLDLWESRTERSGEIDTQTVNEAVPFERICEDMSLELAELFPKHSELQGQAARLLIRLGECGERKQTQLAKDLDMEPYTLSRILAKLEAHRYISRKRDGKDKVVSLLEKTPSALPSIQELVSSD